MNAVNAVGMDEDKFGLALALVAVERARQEQLFPGQTCAGFLPHAAKLAVLLEEVGEVAHELTEALNESPGGIETPDIDNLRTELTQVASCAIAWVESLL